MEIGFWAIFKFGAGVLGMRSMGGGVVGVLGVELDSGGGLGAGGRVLG